MLDPFSDWDRPAVVEHDAPHFEGLERARLELAALPDTERAYAPSSPASLSRFKLDTMPPAMERRFLKYVTPTQLDWYTPCWLWGGGTHDKGYGRFYLGKDPIYETKVWSYTHRISFEHWIGFPPPGYIVDHQCNHKLCCNPTHLWPETNNNNLRLADQRRPWKRRNQYSQE